MDPVIRPGWGMGELRLGLDRDLDGHYDRDELDAGTDPADRTMPKAKGVPPGRRP